MKQRAFKEFFTNVNTAIITTSDFYTAMPEWLDFYNSDEYKRRAVDRYYLRNYGNLIVDEMLIADNDNATTLNIQHTIMEHLLLNLPMYNRLWLDYNAEYNPIHNYNRIEENIRTYGSRITTENLGEINNSETLDNTTSRTIDGIVPFDRTAFSDTNESTTTVNGSDGGKIHNTNKSEERTNVTTENARTDKDSMRMYGNIGVTTSVQMLTEDVNFWENNLKFYDILFKNCIRECTIGMWLE